MVENPTPAASPAGNQRGRQMLLLSLAALGVVYGDIGTSPLYAVRECFQGPHAIQVSPLNVLGVLSLVFWALVLIISVKYLIFILQADNRGEGGILALAALITPVKATGRANRGAVLILGLFGAALLYADGMITPAISVLSAVEGLGVAAPHLFENYIELITIVILVSLFFIQSRGTTGVGTVFGPVILVWFLTIAVIGTWNIFHVPGILRSVNPLYAVEFFWSNGSHGFLILGTVFLVVTGGEGALCRHRSLRPLADSADVVLRRPAVAVAQLLRSRCASPPESGRIGPSILRNGSPVGPLPPGGPGHGGRRDRLPGGDHGRLFLDAPSDPAWLFSPFDDPAHLVAPTGADLHPRGQLGVDGRLYRAGPRVPLLQQSGRRLRRGDHDDDGHHHDPVLRAGSQPLEMELARGDDLIGSLSDRRSRVLWRENITKIGFGGWFPLVVAGVVFLLMSTWRRGRQILSSRLRERLIPLDLFLADLLSDPPLRVPGIAVFMSGNPIGTPSALRHNVMHNKVLHKTVVVLSIETAELPHLDSQERTEIEEIGEGVWRVVVRYGFMEEPDIPSALASMRLGELEFAGKEVSYFLGRETIVATRKPGMARWREQLFVWMSRNAQSATQFFNLPPDRVVEVGVQVEI